MKYVLIFIYVAISILLFVLNWDLFTTVTVVDLGFGKFDALPFLILQIFGGIILGIFALVDGVKDLKREVKISELEKTILTLQKDSEIANLKKAGEVQAPDKILVKENIISSSSNKDA